jgi:hypothetical protein
MLILEFYQLEMRGKYWDLWRIRKKLWPLYNIYVSNDSPLSRLLKISGILPVSPPC